MFSNFTAMLLERRIYTASALWKNLTLARIISNFKITTEEADCCSLNNAWWVFDFCQ
jgi:hypothetical protein